VLRKTGLQGVQQLPVVQLLLAANHARGLHASGRTSETRQRQGSGSHTTSKEESEDRVQLPEHHEDDEVDSSISDTLDDDVAKTEAI